MQKLGVTVRSDGVKCAPPIKEEEVSARSLEKIQIEQVINGISLYEQNLNEKLNLDIVESLMGYYQQGIEYFSAMNDERFQGLIQRMHILLSREDVQVILTSKETKQKVTPHLE